MSDLGGFRGWPLWRQGIALIRRPYRRAHRQFRGLPPKPIRTVMDIGAHKGEFTDLALDYFQPAKVWMVEAIPDLAANLSSRYSNRPQCAVIHAAITAQSGDVTFRVNSHLASSSLLPVAPAAAECVGKKFEEERRITVPGLSLDDLFTERRIDSMDLMKVDIQGAERFLIQGGQQALRRVSILSMEVLFERLYEGCALFGELHAALIPLGFHLFGFHGWRRGPGGFLLYADAIFTRRSP
ncbi:MAG: FkbM family methyltransferase [Verrucomicrobia bacterium]|nr:FkbM family methyltransferase [Verrucomicrobiota bacterium]MBI3870683.1 FkbM family methyltransferase [Verrucomicrobiota bacterium]